jgi:hypothetical protein
MLSMFEPKPPITRLGKVAPVHVVQVHDGTGSKIITSDASVVFAP